MNKTDVTPDTAGKKPEKLISDEVLRAFYREHIDSTTLLEVARRSGIPKSTLNSFVAGVKPHPRIRHALERYCITTRNIDPRTDALRVVVGGDRTLEKVVLRSIAEHHRASGNQIPEWVASMLCDPNAS